MAREIKIDFKIYNELALQSGLKKWDINYEDITNEELGKMLSFALGFVDYTNPKMVKAMLKEARKENEK